MPRQAFWMIAIFVIALGAGLLAGYSFLPSRPPHEVPPSPEGERSWLKTELNLTDEQADKIKAIWSELLRNGGPRHGDARRQTQKERDDAIVALLTPEQKKEYDKIAAKYNDRMNEANRQREAAFQQAIEKTKALLNETQREKYDSLMKKGFRGGPPWGRPGGGPPGRGPDGPDGPGGPRPEPATREKSSRS